MLPPLAFVTQAYAALGAAVREVDEPGSWQPTGCLGWSVRDLTLHCWSDAARALVALHTPSGQEADLDAVTYWQSRRVLDADGQGATNGRRFTRVVASMFADWSQLRGEYLDTAAAVLVAAQGRAPDDVVATQGHVITIDDLLSTLAVEATIHHLDLVGGGHGAPGPEPDCLASTRRVVDRVVEAVAGQRFPATWTDERCVLLGTGRADPTPAEADELGVSRGFCRSSADASGVGHPETSRPSQVARSAISRRTAAMVVFVKGTS